MSQKKSERKPSNFQILNDAKKLRNDIDSLLLRDFGIKDTKRNPRFLEYACNMEPDDREMFDDLLNKYQINSIINEYPAWFINNKRYQLQDTLYKLIQYIEYGNIYATCAHEWTLRRDYHTKALSQINILYFLLDEVAAVLPCDRNKFKPYFEQMEKLIAAIKALRKSDNKRALAATQKERDTLVDEIAYLTGNHDKASRAAIYRLADLLFKYGA